MGEDHVSYRQWVHSSDFPDAGRFAYLDGHLWVDISMERLIHNRIKAEYGRVLGNIEKEEKKGFLCVDRMLLSHLEADLSTEPDGMYVSNESLTKGLAVVNGGDDTIEIIGSADMTLEVVSPTSVEKDTMHLMRLHWEAKGREYWLVDPREKTFSFNIYRYTPAKFVAVRKVQGWIKSQVFHKEFRLQREPTDSGVPTFCLETR